MANDNPLWGEERIANELLVKPRHRVGEDVIVHARSVLGGLHHEYSFASLGR